MLVVSIFWAEMITRTDLHWNKRKETQHAIVYSLCCDKDGSVVH